MHGYMVKKTNDAYLNIQETLKPNKRGKNVCASALSLNKRRVVTRELVELTPPPSQTQSVGVETRSVRTVQRVSVVSRGRQWSS